MYPLNGYPKITEFRALLAALASDSPITCREASQVLGVHPRTIKRMARGGKVPGHFRFGRWYFYASELDGWMRMELNSARHP